MMVVDYRAGYKPKTQSTTELHSHLGGVVLKYHKPSPTAERDHFQEFMIQRILLVCQMLSCLSGDQNFRNPSMEVEALQEVLSVCPLCTYLLSLLALARWSS